MSHLSSARPATLREQWEPSHGRAVWNLRLAGVGVAYIVKVGAKRAGAGKYAATVTLGEIHPLGDPFDSLEEAMDAAESLLNSRMREFTRAWLAFVAVPSVKADAAA